MCVNSYIKHVFEGDILWIINFTTGIKHKVSHGCQGIDARSRAIHLNFFGLNNTLCPQVRLTLGKVLARGSNEFARMNH